MKKLLKTAALTGGILFAVKGLDNRIEVTHYDISSPKIPEGFEQDIKFYKFQITMQTAYLG